MQPKLDNPYLARTHCRVVGGALTYVQLYFNTSSTSSVVLILGGIYSTNYIMDEWHFQTPRISEIAFWKGITLCLGGTIKHLAKDDILFSLYSDQ